MAEGPRAQSRHIKRGRKQKSPGKGSSIAVVVRKKDPAVIVCRIRHKILSDIHSQRFLFSHGKSDECIKGK